LERIIIGGKHRRLSPTLLLHGKGGSPGAQKGYTDGEMSPGGKKERLKHTGGEKNTRGLTKRSKHRYKKSNT